MVIGLVLALIRLFSICTSQDLKRSSSYDDLPSSRIDLSPFRNGRDRRTTHWESRLNSNFETGDVPLYGDRGQGQIPYLSILEEPSLPSVPTSLETSVRSTIRNYDATGKTMEDSNSTPNRCIDEVLLSRRSIVSLLSLTESLQNPKNIGQLVIPRCRRQIHDWTLQQPVYVEEPRWIIIEIDRKNTHAHSIQPRDPFYVARGKRLVTFVDRTKQDLRNDNPKITSADSIISTDRDDSDKISLSTTRKKREIFGDHLKKYLSFRRKTYNDLVTSEFRDQSNVNKYLYPRNKHSDIFEILNEPFFISRGKKNSLAIKPFEFENLDHEKILLNDETIKRILDTCSARDYDTDLLHCSLKINEKTNEANSQYSEVVEILPFRDRRGVEEELLKENDPFYAARGKRSAGPSKKRGLSANKEITNENSSGSVKH